MNAAISALASEYCKLTKSASRLKTGSKSSRLTLRLRALVLEVPPVHAIPIVGRRRIDFHCFIRTGQAFKYAVPGNEFAVVLKNSPNCPTGRLASMSRSSLSHFVSFTRVPYTFTFGKER